jgi:hypothetical protein
MQLKDILQAIGIDDEEQLILRAAASQEWGWTKSPVV